MPSTVRRLSLLVANDPVQRARVAEIENRIDDYETHWVHRVVAVAVRPKLMAIAAGADSTRSAAPRLESCKALRIEKRDRK